MSRETENECARRSCAGDPGIQEARSAGLRALGRDDIRAALSLLTRASELCPSDDPEAREIPLHRAEALRLAGRSTEANQLLAQLEKAAAAVGDRGAEWRAKIARSRILVSATKVETDELGDIIEHAVRVFSELDDDWGLSKTGLSTLGSNTTPGIPRRRVRRQRRPPCTRLLRGMRRVSCGAS